MQFLGCLETALVNLGGNLSPSVRQRLTSQTSQDQQTETISQKDLEQPVKSDTLLGIKSKILPLSLLGRKKV